MARVRLFAVLREIAGDAEIDVDGRTVDDVVRFLGEKFGARFEDIARAGTAVSSGERVPLDHQLGIDEEVALLPPVSGGEEMPRRPQRVLLVANPVARAVSRATLDVIEKAMTADFKLEVDETTGRGHATELARQAVADQIDMMVVFSGDGTVSEAVNGLARSEVALGVIPGGATNVLARVTGSPEDPVEATGLLIRRALEGRPRRIHLGVANDRYFVLNCGIGVDAAAMAEVDERQAGSKRAFERAALSAVLRAVFFRYAGKAPDMRVTVDGHRLPDAVTVTTGRTDPYTFYKRAGVRLTPRANLAEGLDVMAVRRLTRRSAPRLARQVFSGRLIRRRDVAYVHDASSVEVEAMASPFPVQMDGDYVGKRERVSMRLERDALWLFG